jgi:hypothetical protein
MPPPAQPILAGFLFPSLPEELAARTRFYPAKDARIVLVHVPQTHMPPCVPTVALDDEEREGLAARIEAANESQRWVHGVLRSLARGGWDRVFAEGEAEGGAPLDLLTVGDEYTAALRRIDAVLGGPSPSLLERFGANGPDAADDDPLWESTRYAPGASLLLALSGEIRLHGAESPDLHGAAIGALRLGGAAAAARWSPAREDAVVARVAAAGDGPAVVVLGAAHDLARSVAAWNDANPTRRMSLVVVAAP